MNGKQRWPANIARQIANELVAELQPRCEQICIAGSLRRRKAEVGDIEILYVPRMGQVHKSGELFPRPGSLADELFEQWLARSVIRKRPNINGGTTWGSQNKLAVHGASGIPVDLFATTAEQWFVALVVRTGSKDINITLAASARKRRMQLESYGGLIDVNGERIFPQSEREVFELCGVPYREPHER
jgi:DNA polymerase/3'-5' exonuclease PolX